MALTVKVYDYTPQKPLIYTLKHLHTTDTIKQLWEAVCKAVVTAPSEAGFVRRKQRYKADWLHLRILSHSCNHVCVKRILSNS
jgi:hypothetical protein